MGVCLPLLHPGTENALVSRIKSRSGYVFKKISLKIIQIENKVNVSLCQFEICYFQLFKLHGICYQALSGTGHSMQLHPGWNLRRFLKSLTR